MSVTATENFAMAAAVAEGDSVLINAASEPHVQDLCGALAAMGAKIRGIGTSRLEITGVDRLHGAEIAINTDYHEVVTFLALGAITGGEVRVERTQPEHMDLIVRAFAKLGVKIGFEGRTAIVPAGQWLAIEEPYTAISCRRSKRRRGLISRRSAARAHRAPRSARRVRSNSGTRFTRAASPGCPNSRNLARTSS